MRLEAKFSLIRVQCKLPQRRMAPRGEPGKGAGVNTALTLVSSDDVWVTGGGSVRPRISTSAGGFLLRLKSLPADDAAAWFAGPPEDSKDGGHATDQAPGPSWRGCSDDQLLCLHRCVYSAHAAATGVDAAASRR